VCSALHLVIIVTAALRLDFFSWVYVCCLALSVMNLSSDTLLRALGHNYSHCIILTIVTVDPFTIGTSCLNLKRSRTLVVCKENSTRSVTRMYIVSHQTPMWLQVLLVSCNLICNGRYPLNDTCCESSGGKRAWRHTPGAQNCKFYAPSCTVVIFKSHLGCWYLRNSIGVVEQDGCSVFHASRSCWETYVTFHVHRIM
jgi:hypothetical protein